MWHTGWRLPSTTGLDFIIILAEASTKASLSFVPTRWMIAIKERDRGSSEIEVSAPDQSNKGEAAKAKTDPLARTSFSATRNVSVNTHSWDHFDGGDRS